MKPSISFGEIIFLVCEDVRVEVGHKLSVLGLFAGNDILFQPNSNFTLPSLTILFLVRDLRSALGVTVQVQAKGPSWPANEPVTWPLEPEGTTAAFMIKLQNIKLEPGDYEFELSIASEFRRFVFRVAEQRSPGAPS